MSRIVMLVLLLVSLAWSQDRDTNALLAFERGKLEFGEKKYAKASGSFEKGLRLAKNAEAHYYVALCAIELKNPQKADVFLQYALAVAEIECSGVVVVVVVARLASGEAPSPEDREEKHRQDLPHVPYHRRKGVRKMETPVPPENSIHRLEQR